MDPSNGSGNGTPGTVALDPIQPPRGYSMRGKFMLAAIVVLFTVVLLILFVHLYVRWRVYRRRCRLRGYLRRRQRNHLAFASGELAAPSPAAPRGLEPHVLKSLPVVAFSVDHVIGGDAECAVCLDEFDEGEKVRVLPRCDHRFHLECIDLWFGSHNTCPLCRSPVEIESPETPPPPPAQQCAGHSGESSSDSAANQEVSIEIHDSGSSGEAASGAKSRNLVINMFLWGHLRLGRGETDLERGEAAVRNPPAAPPLEAAD